MRALNTGGCGGNIGQRKTLNMQHLLVVRLQALDHARNTKVVVAFSAIQGPAGTMAWFKMKCNNIYAFFFSICVIGLVQN